jgi:Protein of unknown function DUF262/HNH endonuclease
VGCSLGVLEKRGENAVPKHKVTQSQGVFALAHLHNTDKIWLNPEYQREEVWTKPQKQLLIDSLLIGIDIPKFYFREVNKPPYEYEVVDGQQRLRAIFEFIDNQYPLPSAQKPIDGEVLKNKRFHELSSALQVALQNTSLDVVFLGPNYTDDDIEEIFLRLQNGTPLNAAEKRRAIAGTMRTVVAKLSKNKVFKLAGFSPKRYANEDAVAKVLHQLLIGSITDIKPTSIAKTYEKNKSISENQKDVVRLGQAYNFISGAFKNKQSPKFKKHAMITVPYLTVEMLDTYDLSQHKAEFADAYLDFEATRITDGNLPEEQQNPRLAAYSNAARSDLIPDMQYRHQTLGAYFVEKIPDLILKDPARSFTEEQRLAIYRRNDGKCQWPGCGIACEESDFHADHVKPHSLGGETTVQNGQVLCAPHNLAKGNTPQVVPQTTSGATLKKGVKS